VDENLVYRSVLACLPVRDQRKNFFKNLGTIFLFAVVGTLASTGAPRASLAPGPLVCSVQAFASSVSQIACSTLTRVADPTSSLCTKHVACVVLVSALQ
jgi:hypothetical protein